MVKQNPKRQKAAKDVSRQKNSQKDSKESVFSPRVERVYKLALRSMSWIVGTAIIMVIGLFYFDSPTIDKISQIIFYIGIITLILFIIVELASFKFKLVISKLISESSDAKNTNH